MKSILRSGDIVSFSAGGGAHDLRGSRRLTALRDPLAELRVASPALSEWLGSGPPLMVQAYPARLTNFSSAVLVDSYLRPHNVARGMSLAHNEHLPVCLLAQPLVAAHMLLEALKMDCPLPHKMLLVLGGYTCPATLEDWLCGLLRQAGSDVRVLHAYGTAEIDAACLLGMREDPARPLVFRVATPGVEVEILGGELWLRRGEVEVATGDRAVASDGGFLVTAGPGRMAADVECAFATWGAEAWRRRTGYVARTPGGLRWQLRVDSEPHAAEEVEHFSFCRIRPMSWLDKPQWA